MGTLTGGTRAREIEALLLLDSLPRVGPATVRDLVTAYGSARRALERGQRTLGRIAGDEAVSALGRGPARTRVATALRRARGLGMRVVLAGDPDYPRRLEHLADPPRLLFLRGRHELLSRPGVAIVGSRRATARSRDVAERLGAVVAAAGVPVVSGLALGIDVAAHRGALGLGGPTVAVLGCGADRAYPRANARVFRRIADEGLVVSEFAPGTPPLPHHFPRRNRILAALSDVLVVVEAGARSGALISVEHALDLGLDVWAVPGPIDEPTSSGNNRLLVDGARPLVSIDAFARDVLGSTAGPRPHEVEQAGGALGAVLGVLGSAALPADEVARRARLDTGTTLALLSRLELDGRVRRAPGMRFRRAS